MTQLIILTVETMLEKKFALSRHSDQLERHEIRINSLEKVALS